MKRFYSGFQGLRSSLEKWRNFKWWVYPLKRKESECVVVGSLTLLDSSSDALELSNRTQNCPASSEVRSLIALSNLTRSILIKIRRKLRRWNWHCLSIRGRWCQSVWMFPVSTAGPCHHVTWFMWYHSWNLKVLKILVHLRSMNFRNKSIEISNHVSKPKF